MSIEDKIKKNYDLTFLNTFRLRGKARFFIEVKNKEEVIRAIGWAKKKQTPFYILGGGSNILIAKPLINGLVIRISGEDYKIKKNIIASWAGSALTKLSKAALDHRLTGLEWAWGLPGTLGGAVRGNAGAFGLDISKSVIEIEAYDSASDRLIKMNNKDCAFSYRGSLFKQNPNLVVLNIKLELKPGDKKEISDLAMANFNKRLIGYPKEPSAGCVFKNLHYENVFKENKELAETLKSQGRVKGEKIGTAYLIDQAGLKNQTKGKAKISDQHANFIMNMGEANAEDVIYLIKMAKKKIKEKYNIDLEEEVQYFN